MEYKYKSLNRAIIVSNEHDNDIDRSEAIEEIDEVYAKAEAFDTIIETYKNRFGAEDALAKYIVFEEVENAYMESGDRS